MAAITQTGGNRRIGSTTPFHFSWRGARVIDAQRRAQDDALEQERREVLDDLLTSIHVETGWMRALAFARVEIRGDRRVLEAGSGADYAIYEEARHPQIHMVMDRHVPHVTGRLRDAAKRAGF